MKKQYKLIMFVVSFFLLFSPSVKAEELLGSEESPSKVGISIGVKKEELNDTNLMEEIDDNVNAKSNQINTSDPIKDNLSNSETDIPIVAPEEKLEKTIEPIENQKQIISHDSKESLDMNKKNSTNDSNKYEELNKIEVYPTITVSQSSEMLSSDNSFSEETRAKEEIYEVAKQNKNNPYEALKEYIIGYKLYPEDSRFADGIANSTKTILSWSIDSHRRGNFQSAINGYNTIIRTQGVPQQTRSEAEKWKALAGSAIILEDANGIYQRAQNESDPYKALGEYVKGNSLYSDDTRFIDGIANSTNTILSWSKSSHRRGNLQSAISGYNTIIGAQKVPGKTRSEAEKWKGLAELGIVLEDANEIYRKVQNESDPYKALREYVKGNGLYPDDTRFIEGIASSTQIILSWSKGSHERGNFQSAINGYNMILGAPKVPDSIQKETTYYLSLAKSGVLPNKTTIKYSNYNHTLNDVVNIQIARSPQTDKYRNQPVYIESKYVDECRSSSAMVKQNVRIRTSPDTNLSNNIYMSTTSPVEVEILNKNIKGSSYEGSTVWYRIKHNNNSNLYVHSKLIDETGETYYKVNSTASVKSDMNVNSHTYGTIKSGDTINIRKTSSNNWYEVIGYGTWRNPTRQDLEQYVNPKNWIVTNTETININMYQFLVLSGSTGVKASQLNTELQGKGVLAGKGNAFVEASRQNNVNEAYLMAHAFLETGNGTSTLAKGVVYNGKRVYNIFGIGALDQNPINLGAKRAYEEGWFTVEDAIIGGANWIARNYINNPTYKQDTLYKMRWNPAIPGQHQYATDIGWAVKQTKSMDVMVEICLRNGIPMIFDIPAYK